MYYERIVLVPGTLWGYRAVPPEKELQFVAEGDLLSAVYAVSANGGCLDAAVAQTGLRPVWPGGRESPAVDPAGSQLYVYRTGTGKRRYQARQEAVFNFLLWNQAPATVGGRSRDIWVGTARGPAGEDSDDWLPHPDFRDCRNAGSSDVSVLLRRIRRAESNDCRPRKQLPKPPAPPAFDPVDWDPVNEKLRGWRMWILASVPGVGVPEPGQLAVIPLIADWAKRFRKELKRGDRHLADWSELAALWREHRLESGLYWGGVRRRDEKDRRYSNLPMLLARVDAAVFGNRRTARAPSLLLLQRIAEVKAAYVSVRQAADAVAWMCGFEPYACDFEVRDEIVLNSLTGRCGPYRGLERDLFEWFRFGSGDDEKARTRAEVLAEIRRRTKAQQTEEAAGEPRKAA